MLSVTMAESNECETGEARTVFHASEVLEEWYLFWSIRVFATGTRKELLRSNGRSCGRGREIERSSHRTSRVVRAGERCLVAQ